MTRSARLVSGAAFLAGLCAAAGPARAADPDKFLPADADTVVVVDLRQVLASDLVKKYALEQLKQVLDGRDAKKLLADVGLDPLRDIETVVVATVDTSRTDTKFLAVAHGAFDPDKLVRGAEAKAKEFPGQFAVGRDGNATVFTLTPEQGQPVYAAVVGNKTVVASNEKKLVTAALAAATRPAAVRKELAELIRGADDKASVYAVSLLKGKLTGVTLPESVLAIKLGAFDKLLPKLEAATVGVRVGADVAVTATLRLADETAAGDMRAAIDDLLKQVKPLAQLAGLSDPRYKPLTDVLATVKTASAGRDVTVSGKVTGDQIGKMLSPGE